MTNFSYQIDQQFPAIYREHGQELIDLVKTYYRFLETIDGQPIRELRNMPVNRDIDTTMSEFLIFFKNKYLAGLPYGEDSTRFMVKHILDLYRRKGTEQGIELFFKMFYDAMVDIYYPSIDILKPSASAWSVSKYIEMYPDSVVTEGVIGLEIVGSISGAKATIDFVTYTSVGYAVYPTIFLSSVRGVFAIEDVIHATGGIRVGKIRGSLSKISLPEGVQGTYGNHVGDNLEVDGISSGRKATASVTSITKSFSGSIPFKIKDGGYGYSLDYSEITLTEQTVFVTDSVTPFKEGDVVTQGDAKGVIYVSYGGSMSVKHDFDSTAPFESGVVSVNGIDYTATFVSEFNNTARASVGTIRYASDIEVIIDPIRHYLDVPLNAPNYSDPPATAILSGHMPTGLPPINANSIIDTAFNKLSLRVGSISGLTDINEGFGYNIEPSVRAREPYISQMKLRSQMVSLVNSTISLPTGTEVYQSNGARGAIDGRRGRFYTIEPRSFTRFVRSLPLTTATASYVIGNLAVDETSRYWGDDAVISGETEFNIGRITEVEVISSGFGFSEGEVVSLKNTSRDTGETLSLGIASIGGQGKTAGEWISNSSQLNSNKVLQDSDYYQDYSYEIMTQVSEKAYDEVYLPNIHPVGTKKFHRFTMTDSINNPTIITLEIEKI